MAKASERLSSELCRREVGKVVQSKPKSGGEPECELTHISLNEARQFGLTSGNTRNFTNRLTVSVIRKAVLSDEGGLFLCRSAAKD